MRFFIPILFLLLSILRAWVLVTWCLLAIVTYTVHSAYRVLQYITDSVAECETFFLNIYEKFVSKL